MIEAKKGDTGENRTRAEEHAKKWLRAGLGKIKQRSIRLAMALTYPREIEGTASEIKRQMEETKKLA